MAHGVGFSKVHVIDLLLDEYVAEVDVELARAAKFAVELTDYAVLVRYPNEGERLDRQTARRALEVMDRAWALFEPRVTAPPAVEAAAEDAAQPEATDPDPDA